MMAMADAGNYRESRYFTAYRPSIANETYLLPIQFAETFGQKEAPFGIWNQLLEVRRWDDGRV